jgi:hypothetical protein
MALPRFGAGAGVSDPDLVELSDCRHDRGLAEIYIAGEAGRLYGDTIDLPCA